MADTQVLGVPSPRVEGEDKVGGEAILCRERDVGVMITSLSSSGDKVINALRRDKDSRSD